MYWLDYEREESWALAEKEGHQVTEIDDATKQADIVHILIPDMEQSTIYRKHVAQHLSEGKPLVFRMEQRFIGNGSNRQEILILLWLLQRVRDKWFENSTKKVLAHLL